MSATIIGNSGDTQRVEPYGEDSRTKALSGNMTYVNSFKCLLSSFQINIIPIKIVRLLWGLLLRTHRRSRAAELNAIQSQPSHPNSLEAPTPAMLSLGDLNGPIMHQRVTLYVI
jgi:hypothetical protein